MLQYVLFAAKTPVPGADGVASCPASQKTVCTVVATRLGALQRYERRSYFKPHSGFERTDRCTFLLRLSYDGLLEPCCYC